jgi:Aminomethyltransferase folate-binding domain
LKRIPLHALHVSLGAKMVPFAGYEMPVQYAAGVLKEHRHTSQAAGLFDVSHMGQIALRAKSGAPEDTALALERLVPQDILGLTMGRQRYAQLTNESGGIMIAIRKEIAEVEDGRFEIAASSLRHAPHTVHDIADDGWQRAYSRAEGCFPDRTSRTDKYWCPVGRVDNVYGDRNLICSCPPVSDYAQAAE